MNWETILPGLVNAAGDVLVYSLGEKRAKEKIAERAAILAARMLADQRAAEKFAKPTPAKPPRKASRKT